MFARATPSSNEISLNYDPGEILAAFRSIRSVDDVPVTTTERYVHGASRNSN